MIANLRPSTFDDFGLAAAISLKIERLRKEGCRVDYEEEFGATRLPNAAEIHHHLWPNRQIVRTAIFEYIEEPLQHQEKTLLPGQPQPQRVLGS